VTAGFVPNIVTLDFDPNFVPILEKDKINTFALRWDRKAQKMHGEQIRSSGVVF
jgi:hypothetical protein